MRIIYSLTIIYWFVFLAIFFSQALFLAALLERDIQGESLGIFFFGNCLDFLASSVLVALGSWI